MALGGHDARSRERMGRVGRGALRGEGRGKWRGVREMEAPSRAYPPPHPPRGQAAYVYPYPAYILGLLRFLWSYVMFNLHTGGFCGLWGFHWQKCEVLRVWIREDLRSAYDFREWGAYARGEGRG